jgi:hypothetical protein
VFDGNGHVETTGEEEGAERAALLERLQTVRHSIENWRRLRCGLELEELDYLIPSAEIPACENPIPILK